MTLFDPTLAHLLGWSLSHPVTGREIPTDQASRNIEVDETLVSNAIAHRVTGALLATDGQIAHIPEDLKESLGTTHDGVMMWCLLLEQRLLEIKEWFDAAGGIDFRIIKGASVAHLDEIDSSLRSFADIDMLIAESDMDKAIKILTDNGAKRRIAQRRPGFDRRFTKGVGTRFDDGIELDIHRTLANDAHGFRIPTTDLFSDPEPFVLGGQTFLAMARPHRALHAAYHAVASSSTPAFHTVRDLAGYLNDPSLGPDVLVPIAKRWRGLEVLGEAVQVTLETFTLDTSTWSEWLQTEHFDPAETELLARGRSERSTPMEWSTVSELPWLDRARFAFAVLVPTKEHTDSLIAAGELEGDYWKRRFTKLRQKLRQKLTPVRTKR